MTGRSRTRLSGILAVAVVAGVLAIGTNPANPQTSGGTIKALHSGKVMDVLGASTAQGAPVVQWSANGGNNQAWKLQQFGLWLGHPIVLIQSVRSGKVLDAVNSTPATHLVQNEWSGAASQWWIAYPFGTTGYTVLININSGMVADVGAVSHDNGAPIVQWHWIGGLNQLWTIPAVINLSTTTTTGGATTTTTSGATTTTTAAPTTTTTAPSTTTTTTGGNGPSISGMATLLAPVGQPISDTATLSGGTNPTGTMRFRAWTNGECSGTPVFDDTVTVAGNGPYTSGQFVATQEAAYVWTASYSGDANDSAVATVCGDEDQISLVFEQ